MRQLFAQEQVILGEVKLAILIARVRQVVVRSG
jgi:hypothetical protein